MSSITPDDCYFYGIVLGDGHVAQKAKHGYVSLHTENKKHLKDWLVTYFTQRYMEHRIVVDGNTTRVYWNKNTLIPFQYGDVYDSNGEKHVHYRWLNLPLTKSSHIVKGLLHTDGSLGKEFVFDSTSRQMIESMRYILLRMGILTSGYIRDRRGETHMTSNGPITNKKIAYSLRVPKTKQITDLLGMEESTGQFTKFFRHGNFLFGRVKSIEKFEHEGTLYDLHMENVHKYITHNGLVHNGGGKRKGSIAVYLEPHHADVMEFLELRLPVGAEESRCRDLFCSTFQICSWSAFGMAGCGP